MVRRPLDEVTPSADDASKPKDDWRKNLDRDSFEYVWRDTWDRFGTKIKIGLAAAAIAITALSSAYTVKNDSVGIEKTFGAYSGTTKSGLHFLVPFVQSVDKVQNQAIHTEAFGFRTFKPGIKSEYIGVSEIASGKVDKGSLSDIIEEEGLKPEDNLAEQATNILRQEYLMLSGDLNMADVEWIVQYKVSDPIAYSFNVRDPRKVLRDVSEAVMRLNTGDASIDELLTTGRTDIEVAVKSRMQQKLNQYNTGMEVGLVQMQSSNPPERVRPSFNEVNSAIQTRQQKINQAMEQYNKEIPKARGEALATIQEAEGYATQRVNNAKGDVARFQQVYHEFQKAPGITRSRMYLEAMPGILGNSKQIYFIENQSNGLLLKKLDLDGGAK